MAHVAKRENLPESLIMEEVARGRIDHPRQHQPHQPGADGDRHRQQVQVNANIGASPNASDAAEDKLQLAVKYGADTVMDLSTGGVNLDEVRTAIINASPVHRHGARLRS